MDSISSTSANRDKCPVCNKPYREENMVECTQCGKWCCYECVNFSEDIVNNDSWKCPKCDKKTIATETNKFSNNIVTTENSRDQTVSQKSHKSNKSTKVNSNKSSHKIRMKLKLLQEERELLKQERYLARQARILLDEDDSDSQELDNEELELVDPLTNHLLSLEIEKQLDKKDIPNEIHATNAGFTKMNDKVHETHNQSKINNRIEEKSSLTHQQCLARQSVSKELPYFSGNTLDWPLFIASFDRSTELCGFDNNENLLRLQRSLKGSARAAVSSFLILPECVPQIMSTLKMLFGRPEQILESQFTTIRHLPAPRAEKLETLVEYALAVKNLCVSLEASKMTAYFNNPTLMHELTEKLPSQIKINWALYRSTLNKEVGIEDFSNWLYNMATNVCTALPTLTIPDRSKQFQKNDRLNIHNFEGNTSNYFQTPSCKICGIDCKNISECREFQNLSVTKRWNIVKNLHLCLLCLKRHRFPCRYPVKCEQCQRKHHPLLHTDDNPVLENNLIPSQSRNMKSPSNSEGIESYHMLTSSDDFSIEQNISSIQFRILPVELENAGIRVSTYAFLDEGSSVTLIDKDLAKELELSGTQTELCLKWTSDQQRLEKSEKINFSIAGSYYGAKKFEHCTAFTVESLNLPKQTLNSLQLKRDYSYLQNIPFHSYNQAKPKILIGLDNWDLGIPIRVKEGSKHQPIAAKCRLGWTVFAYKTDTITNLWNNVHYHICECTNHEMSNDELNNQVKKFFAIEALGIQSKIDLISKELQKARNIQESTLTYDGTKFNIGLLWKNENIKLPDSRNVALHRLESIERKIKQNPELGVKMNDQIDDFIRKGYIRKLTPQELDQKQSRIWYLPIFPVFNPNKPGKFRIVWDAAATTQGVSLNSMLLKGDDQLAALLGVLLRFRQGKIGFSADIKEMFLRVGVIGSDQHAQRFLWRYGNSQNKLETFVVNVLTFGATCSPSCAQFVKNINAKNFSSQYPRAAKSITLNHYVDDLLDSADTEEEAIIIAKQVTLIHKHANFEIRNWRSNSKQVMRMNFASYQEVDDNLDMNLEKTDAVSTEKVLGMWWKFDSDCFIYSLSLNKGNKEVLNGKRLPTKREILRILMSIYDPLGLLSNFLIHLKILLQKIWRSQISWDELITEEQSKEWSVWLQNLQNIEKVKIQRCYLRNLSTWKNVTVQMHVFVDASEQASAAVAYLRLRRENNIECTLVSAKTHVAPLKPQTIPRLELVAAVMGVRLAKTIKKHLTINIDEVFYWSDSTTVLRWIHIDDPRKLCKFVAYRVAEIQEDTIGTNWRYIPTKFNVADEATKWSKPPSFEEQTRWFKGPEFLYEQENSWHSFEPCDQNKILKEEIVLFQSTNVEGELIDIKRFSKFRRLLRTMAFVLKFIEKVRNRKSSNLNYDNKHFSPDLTAEDLLQAKNILIRMEQKKWYPSEMKYLKKHSRNDIKLDVKRSSPIYKLSPYIDENNLLRIRGRLDIAECISPATKRPVILPRESYLSLLIVEDFHRSYQHRNHETVINEIRQIYYIPQLRRLLYKVRNTCQYCKIYFATPANPEMAPLPDCRLAAFTAPFTYTGVDYFGPITVVIGRRQEKRWGVLFTCLTTRAVHLEVAHKLDTDHCILAFTNFMNRRGHPRHIYCDRGSNFIATERVLREELTKVDTKIISQSFLSPEISFHFNSPLSPHMGGAWERLVKAVKISIYSALSFKTPNDSLLLSSMIAAENIVNSRPLTYLPIDSEESEAITPNHFLIGSSNGDKPLGQLDDNVKVLRFNYLYREQFANKCWRRFVSEYVPTLLLRSKWHKQVKPLQVNDLVIICDKNLPRCNWPRGRIIETKIGKDGQVRRAKVETSTGIYERPATKLALLNCEKTIKM